MAPSVLISEVGPRDGLQSIATTMPTAHKLAWIDALHAAALAELGRVDVLINNAGLGGEVDVVDHHAVDVLRHEVAPVPVGGAEVGVATAAEESVEESHVSARPSG